MKFSRPTLLLLGIFVVLIIAAMVTLERNPPTLVLPQANQQTVAADSDLTKVRASLPVLAEQLPAFVGITHWWNTPNGQALTADDLKGKVVLIDFWTYSCINCIRTQPVLKAWWDAYQKDGLVIIGVHTPEFAFEKDIDNVGQAIAKADLKYPIALDPDYRTWNAYGNNSWPAEYVFDRQGKLRYRHVGEGEYAESEQVIRALLADGGSVPETATNMDTTPNFADIQTGETYFGLGRRTGLVSLSHKITSTSVVIYTPRPTLSSVGDWTLGGSWQEDDERITSSASGTTFAMKVQANAMHLVLGSADGMVKRIRVRIDGKSPTDAQLTKDVTREKDGEVYLNVKQKDLYRVAQFADAGVHTVSLEILDQGTEMYTATFGE